MVAKKLSYLDQLKKDEGVEDFQLTDEVSIPPLSLGAIETLEKADKLDPGNMKDVDKILRVLFGTAYDAALEVIPIQLAPKVMEDVLRHFTGDELADALLADAKAADDG